MVVCSPGKANRSIPLEMLESVLNSPQQIVTEREEKKAYQSQTNWRGRMYLLRTIEESDENKPGVIPDYDKGGNVVGMELLDTSKRTGNPRSVEHAVLAESAAWRGGNVTLEQIHQVNQRLTRWHAAPAISFSQTPWSGADSYIAPAWPWVASPRRFPRNRARQTSARHRW